MSYCTPQQLLSYVRKEQAGVVGTDYCDDLPWDQARERLGQPQLEWGDAVVYSRELCATVLDLVHEQVANGIFLEWKSLRPWVVTNVTQGLDTTKPWIGWEIETGWDTHASRKEVITKWNETYKLACTDNEGWGSHPVELTISPRTPAYYSHPRTPIHPLLFVCQYDGLQHEHDADDSVGTHVNFSTPAFRALVYQGQVWVERTINASIQGLTPTEKAEFFGRSRLYAGCFLRGDNSSESAEGAPHWLEGKLFNSTYDEAVAKRYMLVAERLCDVMEQASIAYTEGKPESGNYRWKQIDNFAAILRGEKEAAVFSDTTRNGDGDSIGDSYDDDYYDDSSYPDGFESVDGGVWCAGCGTFHYD